MEPPTAAQVRIWSQQDFDDLGFEIDTTPDPDEDGLQRIVDFASIWLQDTTGRLWEDMLAEEGTLEEQKHRLFMQEAMIMLVEYYALRRQPDIVETAADFDLIQSFSAGSYSEVRRSANTRISGVHPWRELNDLLFGLMTADKLAAYSETPEVGVIEPDWDVGKDIIDAHRPRFVGPFAPVPSPWSGGTPWW